MNIETTEYFIWIAAGLLTTIQLLYTFIIYNAPHRRIVAERKGEQRVSKQQPGISVIIATADCEELLAKHLPLILEQEYPDFEVAQERAQIIEELQSRIMDDWNDSMVGTDLEVLVDGYDEEMGQYFGLSYADSPDVDGRVWIACDEPLREGRFVMVHIDGSAEGELTGYLLED